MARVAIVGVGAIGGVLAALLNVAGRHEVVLCTRRPIRDLTVETPEGLVTVNARNLTDPSLAGPVEWVFVATKTYDAKGAAAWLPSLCRHSAPVAIVQNGVEHRERFAEYVNLGRGNSEIIETIQSSTTRDSRGRVCSVEQCGD